MGVDKIHASSRGALQLRMLALLKFILATAGAAVLFVSIADEIASRIGVEKRISKILTEKPFSCPLCMGFWFGMLFSVTSGLSWFGVFQHGCIGAVCSWIINWIVTKDY